MCGFVGVIYRDRQQKIATDRLAAARDTLEHRGPDEAGLWHRPGIGLGHRRLRVLDLTHGQQPMADEQAALVYNGEIYNFKSLQTDYQSLGMTFDTCCDTEVLFKALKAQHAGALGQLNGMFAFGYWDQHAQTLLLARDRLGQKPLYWFADDQCFVFASELKAVLTWLDRRVELDPVAMDQFFARGYILSPRTIFKQIHKLPAGCTLNLDATTWDWRVQSYWELEPVEVPTDPQKAVDRLDALLSDAVALRMVSDVPIGCLLSGGIDSTLITAMAAKASSEPVGAFSIGFDEDDRFNELPYAKQVAEHHGCQWRHEMVRLGDFISLVDDVVDYFDEPFANFAMFPMRRLAQLARQDLVVVLSGQGGDELAAGYEGRYNWAAAAMQASTSGGGGAGGVSGGVALSPMDYLAQYLHRSTILPWGNRRQSMYARALVDQITADCTGMTHVGPFWMKHDRFDTLNHALYADLKTNLPDYLVCVEERMAMAASLESRNPMLDWRVVNYMMSLPASLKVRDGRYKWILHELALRYGPASAINRPKQGFTPPLGRWIDQSANQLGGVFREAQPLLDSLFSEPWLAHLCGGEYQPSEAMAVYYSLMFTKWLKRYEPFVALPMTSGASVPVAAHRAGDWHQATRDLDSLTLARGRLFAHLFNHFEPTDQVLIVGDCEGWLCQLATDAGRRVIRFIEDQDMDEQAVARLTQTRPLRTTRDLNVSVAGTILVGSDQAGRHLSHQTLAGERLVCLFDFEPRDQARLQPLFDQVAQLGQIAGHQILPFDQTHGALVIRCELDRSRLCVSPATISHSARKVV